MTPSEVFEALHRGLPQQGPGSDASTLRALAGLGPLPARPRILDVGCGPGRQTLALAAATGGHVTAVDLGRDFLSELEVRARAAGLSAQIVTLCASLDALDLPAASFDLVWSEGALYTVGFEKALRALCPLLRPGGFLAATDLSWLVDAPPQRAAAFWRQGYPDMATRAARRLEIEASGYELVDDFALPESDWWDGYYALLEPRITALRARIATGSEASAALDAAQVEIDLYRDCSGAYGYVFYRMRRPE